MELGMTALGIGGFVSGFAAGIVWWRASRIEVVPQWITLEVREPTDSGARNAMWLVGLIDAAERAGKLNARAAVWTAVAALCSGAATFLASICKAAN